jgi:hypothetical protein
MQMDYITPARHMDEPGDGQSVMPLGRERKGSWGEAILTGGAAVDSINNYLQTLAEKADQKRKEHKKKRKERKALKDKKSRRKRSRSQDEGAAKTAHDERAGHVEQPQPTAGPAAPGGASAVHPMTINLVAPSVPTAYPLRSDAQPPRPHLVHSASFPNFPSVQVEDRSIAAQYAQQLQHQFQQQRSHQLPPTSTTTITSPMVGTSGEFYASHPVSVPMSMSMSMPTIPTVSSTLLQGDHTAATQASGWHDAASQWLDAGVPQRGMSGVYPQQHYPQHHQHPSAPAAAFDDTFLSSFLSSDVLQAEDVALLTGLL